MRHVLLPVALLLLILCILSVICSRASQSPEVIVRVVPRQSLILDEANQTGPPSMTVASSPPSMTVASSPPSMTMASSPPSMSVASSPPSMTVASSRCQAGCTERGNCNELTGECACPLTHSGAACDQPLMPACRMHTGGDGGGNGSEINLSFLAADHFWSHERRAAMRSAGSPPYRWVGPLSCECLLQAIAIFSLDRSEAPHEWPPHLSTEALALQRLACVDTELSVSDLWRAGRRIDSLEWSYVPVFAWLKGAPAHAPQLLPNTAVVEAVYLESVREGPANVPLNRMPVGCRASSSCSQRLHPFMVRPSPLRRPLLSMLPFTIYTNLNLLPVAMCGPHACDGHGYCARSEAGHSPRCLCASSLFAQSSTVAFCASPPGSLCSTARDASAHATRCRASADAAGRDFWRHSSHSWQQNAPAVTFCPNQCSGRGQCAFGFCHCAQGSWGLDCGMSLARAALLRASVARPLIYVYELPPALRRCASAAIRTLICARRLSTPATTRTHRVHLDVARRLSTPPTTRALPCPHTSFLNDASQLRCLSPPSYAAEGLRAASPRPQRAPRGACLRTWVIGCCAPTTSHRPRLRPISSGSMAAQTVTRCYPR